jgi:MtrB/PioB family decaheme-associated outer membrane protein
MLTAKISIHGACFSLTLLAWVISSVLNQAHAEGYELQKANRSGIKAEAWSCKQCQPKTGHLGNVSATLANNDGDDSRFGNTTGTDNQGLAGAVGADIIYKTDTGYQTQLVADKLGFDAGSAKLTTGRPGHYQIDLGYRGLANYQHNQLKSPYIAAQDKMLLPDNWVAGGTTHTMPLLQTSLIGQDLRVQRDRFIIGGYYAGKISPEGDNNSHYKASLNYQHEDRTGAKKSSANILTNSVMLAQPINDSTDEIDTRLYFSGSGWQAGINSQISHYKNDHQALQWQSAFTPTFGAAYLGQNAVDPDNKAYRVAAEASGGANGHNVLMHAGFSRMSQDDTFIPATINGPSPTLPTENLEGQVDTLEMNLKYSGRITQDLGVQANYHYRDRDNKTDKRDFPQIVTDSIHRSTAQNSLYDKQTKTLELKGKYRFTSAAFVEAGYRRHDNDYSELDRQSVAESGGFAKLSYRYSPIWSAWLKGEASVRDGSEYDPVTSTQSPSNPLLRKSYLADRKRQKVTLHTDYQSDIGLSLGAGLHSVNDDYHHTLIGLTQVSYLGYYASAQYLLSSNLSLNAYLNQDWRDTEQAGSNQFSAPDWYSISAEKSTQIGAGLVYQNLFDKPLDLGLDYHYSDGQSDTDITYGINSPYGDYYSRKHNINAYAKYKFADSMSLRVDWLFEKYQDANWQNQGTSWDTIPNVLSFGDMSHDYNAHYLGLTLSYQM